MFKTKHRYFQVGLVVIALVFCSVLFKHSYSVWQSRLPVPGLGNELMPLLGKTEDMVATLVNSPVDEWIVIEDDRLSKHDPRPSYRHKRAIAQGVIVTPSTKLDSVVMHFFNDQLYHITAYPSETLTTVTYYTHLHHWQTKPVTATSVKRYRVQWMGTAANPDAIELRDEKIEDAISDWIWRYS